MKTENSTVTKSEKGIDIEDLKTKLAHLSGFEIASMISTKGIKEQVLIFSALSSKSAAEAFVHLSHRTQKVILHSLSSNQIACILKEMRPDNLTSLLEELPKAVVDEYVKLLPPEKGKSALRILEYPEDSVGRLMTTDYIAVKKDWTIERVLEHIREYGHDSETINMIYVVDDQNVLLDDIKIKDFLFYPKDYLVSQIADYKFVALSVYDKSKHAIRIFKEHNLIALPVIDEKGVLLGVVTIDDILHLLSEVNTEEVQKIGGVEALDEPYMDTPFFQLIKKRARWLIVLFLGEMFTATAMGFFEDEIAKAVVLALFLPLIISSGGNAGSQSSTLIIRAMALGEVKLRDWWRIMGREVKAGIMLGIILGCVGFARVTIWSSVSDIYGVHWLLIAITIFLALIGVVLWGSLTGAMLPFILRRLGADPATSSAPLVATLVDVTGIVIYFLIAMTILKGTLL